MLKSLLVSKRVWLTVVGIVGFILNKAFGTVISDEVMNKVVDFILVLVATFGLTGLGKEAAPK
jgi:hypothetical protein